MRQPRIDSQLIERMASIPTQRDIPVISMAFSIGTCFWALIICMGYKILQKEYKFIFLYIPIFILWLTIIASPVFCEFRYAYPMFMTLPVYLSFCLKNNNQKNDHNNNKIDDKNNTKKVI